MAARFTLVFALAFAASLVLTAPSSAVTMLMSTDGASDNNNPRAIALGQTVTQSSLAAMAGLTQSALLAYGVVWVNPSLYGLYGTLQSAVAPGGSFEQYAAGGGVLVLSVGGEGVEADIAPGGVDYSYTRHEAETFATPSHPYLTGVGYGGASLSVSDFDSWRATDHGALSGLYGGSTTVLSNTNGPSWVEYGYGSGRVIVDTLTYGWGSNGAHGPARDNLIQYSAYLSQHIPEPATGGLFLAGLGALVLRRRRARG